MSRTMSDRDLEYIEERLLSPCVRVSDAYERLQRYTIDPELAEQANRLMYAMQMFTDTCRDVQKEVVQIVRRN